MGDITEKTCVGMIGYVASLGIAELNAVLSALVAVLTIIYLSINIWRKINEKEK